MNHAEVEQFVMSLSDRLTHVEQILPTLLTREEFRIAMERIETRFDGIDARFDGIDARFEGVDARFVSIDERFNLLEAAMVRHSREIRSHFDAVAESMHSEIRLIAEGHVSLSERLERVERLEPRVEKLENASPPPRRRR
jgi:hypothetical protein